MVFTAFFPTLRAGGRGTAEKVSNATRRGMGANARTVSSQATVSSPNPLSKPMETWDYLVLDVSGIECERESRGASSKRSGILFSLLLFPSWVSDQTLAILSVSVRSTEIRVLFLCGRINANEPKTANSFNDRVRRQQTDIDITLVIYNFPH